MTEIKNAKVQSTSLGTKDHGIFTAWLFLDYGGAGQGFGGYGMDEPIFDGIPQHANDKRGKFLGRQGTAWGMEFIAKVLSTLEVDQWEKLPGTPCRVRGDRSGLQAIGHYLKDNWFEPKTDLAHLIEATAPAAGGHQ